MCITCHLIRGNGQFGNPHDLIKALLSGMGINPEDDEPQTNAEFIKSTIDHLKGQQLAAAAALSILEAESQPGVELIALDTLRAEPIAQLEGTVPIMTIATYHDTENGMFRVVGQDHTKSETVEYAVPNEHGVKAMQRSVRAALIEPYEKAIEEIVKAGAAEAQPS